MKLFAGIAVVLSCLVSSAVAAPPSDASLKELMEVTQLKRMLTGMQSQMDAMMEGSVRQALQGRVPTPREQQAIDNMKKRMVAVMQKQLDWSKLEAMYLRVYKEAFTEEEVVGMLAFYKTTAGQAVINKLPVMMQKVMIEVQQHVAAMGPEMQKIRQAFLEELQAANAKPVPAQ